MKIENEHSIDLALEAKKASEEFHRRYPNSPFDKFYMGYVKGFQAAMTESFYTRRKMMRIGRLEFGRAKGYSAWEFQRCPEGCLMWDFGPYYITWLRGQCASRVKSRKR